MVGKLEFSFLSPIGHSPSTHHGWICLEMCKSVRSVHAKIPRLPIRILQNCGSQTVRQDPKVGRVFILMELPGLALVSLEPRASAPWGSGSGDVCLGFLHWAPPSLMPTLQKPEPCDVGLKPKSEHLSFVGPPGAWDLVVIFVVRKGCSTTKFENSCCRASLTNLNPGFKYFTFKYFAICGDVTSSQVTPLKRAEKRLLVLLCIFSRNRCALFAVPCQHCAVTYASSWITSISKK